MIESSSRGQQAVDAEALTVRVEAKRLLDRVHVSVEKGELIGLIGPNGAGKSTMLRAMSNVLAYQGGTVSLFGADLASLSSRKVAEILALVPQIAPYTQGFTVSELVQMGRYPHLGRLQMETASDGRIAADALRRTETLTFAARTMDTLSGGERQRVFLARALAQQPHVLLLDEPTANLDVFHQLKIMGLIRGLVDDGLTSIAAIHDLNLAARYCDRVVLLAEGRVLAEGEPEEVLLPETIRAAFRVQAVTYREPVTGSLAVSLIGPIDDHQMEAEKQEQAAPIIGNGNVPVGKGMAGGSPLNRTAPIANQD